MRSLVSVVVLCVFLFSSPYGVVGKDIPLPETINIDPDANLKVTPMSFCGTEDNLFLLPDHQAGTIKVFNKEGNYLKFIKALGPEGVGTGDLKQPMFCAYSREHGLFGVFDYGLKEVFIFERGREKVDFTLIEIFPCERGAYDIAFARNGDVVVSGYVTDKEGNPFDLYSVNIESGQINYLLTSAQKYGLETYDQYVSEYRIKQTIPAQGTQAFIDINDDDLVFVWEASALQIIKFNLDSRSKRSFGHNKTSNYTKPDLDRLASSYKTGDFPNAWQEQKKMAYVRNIFVGNDHIFLVYETARNNSPSTFWLQQYDPAGNYQGEFLIPGSPDIQMWFDAENYDLYAFSKKPGNNANELSILKYKIIK
jgi:hypothetical protein